MKKKKPKPITAEEFDRKFDAGEDVSEYVNWEKGKWVPPSVQRVNVDVPIPMVIALDKEASRIGVTRTALIKMWLAQNLDKLAS